MTVNVYTYYTNKIAIEEARKQQPARPKRAPRPKVAVPGLVQLGLASGFAASAGLTLVLCPAQPPYLLVLGTAWGVALGYLAENARRRFRRFVAALQGAPLSQEDVRALTGRS